MSLQFETTTRNAMLDAITSKVGSNARLRIYSGTAPASCAAALSGDTLLVDLPCSAALAAASTNGVLTVNSITQTNAGGSGTASFFRLYESTGTTCYMQGSVGTTGADLNLNTTAIAAGGPLQITSWTLTAPGA